MDTLNVVLSRVTHGLESVYGPRLPACRTHATVGTWRGTARRGSVPEPQPRGVEAVYKKHNFFTERRAALQSWADLPVQIEAGKSNAVPIRNHRSTANSPHQVAVCRRRPGGPNLATLSWRDQSVPASSCLMVARPFQWVLSARV